MTTSEENILINLDEDVCAMATFVYQEMTQFYVIIKRQLRGRIRKIQNTKL